MKKVRKDVINREKNIEKMSDALLKVSTDTVLRLGQWGRNFDTKELISYRDDFNEILKDSNRSSEKVKKLLLPIERQIQNDYEKRS